MTLPSEGGELHTITYSSPGVPADFSCRNSCADNTIQEWTSCINGLIRFQNSQPLSKKWRKYCNWFFRKDPVHRHILVFQRAQLSLHYHLSFAIFNNFCKSLSKCPHSSSNLTSHMNTSHWHRILKLKSLKRLRRKNCWNPFRPKEFKICKIARTPCMFTQVRGCPEASTHREPLILPCPGGLLSY